jgi:hypothetical protein
VAPDSDELFDDFKNALGREAENFADSELRFANALSAKLAGVLFDMWVKEVNEQSQ